MRKIKNILIIALTIMIFTVQQGLSQTTAPQDPGGSPEAGPPLGGGAPVGNGIYVLLFLGVAYGTVKHLKHADEPRAEEN